jgi:hypothetical protein
MLSSTSPEYPTRVAAIAGLLSIALGLVAATVDHMWDLPATQSRAVEIAAHVQADRTVFFAAMVLNATAVMLWLVFGAGVWLHLRPRTQAEGFLSACYGLGLVSFVTLLLAGFTTMFVLVFRVPDVSDARLLYDLTFGLLAISGPPTALALGAYAGLVFRTGRLPRWTAVLALISAAAHLVLLASFFVRQGFFSLEGAVILVIPGTLFAWIVGTSVALLRAAAAGEK